MKYAKLFALTFSVFFIIDLIWLGFLAQGFYRRELGELARYRDGSFAPRWVPGIAVYALIVAGLVAFVSPRLGDGSSYLAAAAWGAAFGVTLYGVYDLTNLALIDRWTVRLTVVDIVWGGFICGVSSVAMHFFSMWLSSR